MSDSVKKYFEDKSEHEKASITKAQNALHGQRWFVWVLDFELGSVHLYNIRHDADSEDAEKLIELHGHNITNCEWMLTQKNKIYN